MAHKSLGIIYYVAMALVFIGIIMLLTNKQGALIIYAFGALPIVSIRIFNRYICLPEKRRINSILLISSLFLLIAGVSYYLGINYWISFILIMASLDFYASFRKFA